MTAISPRPAADARAPAAGPETTFDVTACPQCGRPAEIQWRTRIGSTHGAVEHVTILCLNRHWFLLPGADLLAVRADWPSRP